LTDAPAEEFPELDGGRVHLLRGGERRLRAGIPGRVGVPRDRAGPDRFELGQPGLRAADVLVSRVLPIGPEVLPSTILTQGWREAPSETRPTGAPLTGIVLSKSMPGTEDGSGPVLQARPLALLNGRVPRTCGCGPAGPAVAARPSGLPPERARHGRRLESALCPPLPRSWSWWYPSLTTRNGQRR